MLDHFFYNFLCKEDENSVLPTEADLLVILSGSARHRHKKAEHLLRTKHIENIAITGEKEIFSKNFGKQVHKPYDTKNTIEDIEMIYYLAIERLCVTIFIVTSKYHTRRVRVLCNKIFKGTNIRFYIIGSDEHVKLRVLLKESLKLIKTIIIP